MRLTDMLEIQQLTARYNRALDDERYEEYASCYTADGVFELVGAIRLVGRDAIRDGARSGGYGSVHQTTDASIDIDGDRASQICTVVVSRRDRSRAGVQLLTTGRYHDDLVRTPNGWRFTHRRVVTDLEPHLLLAALRPESD